MNQTVKIFFTDMDDTLLNSEKQVTKENMDAISEALAAGHKIVFNTGRPLSGFLPILKELGLDREGCYAIAFNGGLIYDCAAKKTLYRRTIPLEYARVIFEKTQEAGLYCHTYSDTSLLCRHAGEEIYGMWIAWPHPASFTSGLCITHIFSALIPPAPCILR